VIAYVFIAQKRRDDARGGGGHEYLFLIRLSGRRLDIVDVLLHGAKVPP
jgi:hypothetical protein